MGTERLKSKQLTDKINFYFKDVITKSSYFVTHLNEYMPYHGNPSLQRDHATDSRQSRLQAEVHGLQPDQNVSQTRSEVIQLGHGW